MLSRAAYLTWHLRKALAPLTFTDENIPQPADPVIPGRRSLRAAVKDAVKQTEDGLPLYRYRDLIDHLGTLGRQVINFSGQQIEKITAPTPVQARAFELLGSPVPVKLSSQRPHPGTGTFPQVNPKINHGNTT